MIKFFKKNTDPHLDPLHTSEQKEEKISEKVFSKNLLMAALGIFICIIALCSATYAWFAESTESGNNTLVSGSFSLEIAVKDAAEAPVEVRDAQNGSKTCTLAAGTYTVTLTMTDESTVKGYCTVKIGDAAYTTSPISRDPSIGAPSLSFAVTVAADTTVVFTPKWGYPATPNLANGDTVSVPAAPADPDSTLDA